jgi:restriction endonuclease S subunit
MKTHAPPLPVLSAGQQREQSTPQYPFSASPVVPTTPTRSGWKWHRLTDIARLATGHTPSRRCPEYWNGDIPWIQLPDIRALDGKPATDTSEHTNELGIANSAAVLLPAGTVCLSRTASVGFVTIMSRPMATSQDFVNWVCGPDLLAEFLMHLLIGCRDPIRELGSGAVHHTIYFPTVESFNVCIPAVPEQKRTAAELTVAMAAVDKARHAAQERLAAAEALPAAYLREVFEGPDASKWARVPLGELCDFKNGLNFRTDTAAGHAVKIIGVGDFQNHFYVPIGSLAEVHPAEPLGDDLLVKTDDIVFVRSNGNPDLVGRAMVVPSLEERVTFTGFSIRARPKDERSAVHFLTHYFKSGDFVKRIRQAGRGSNIRNLSQDLLSALATPLPPLPEQRRVAAELTIRLEAAEALIARCREELAAVEAMPAALLRQAFGSEL